jgi:hypothetical protein
MSAPALFAAALAVAIALSACGDGDSPPPCPGVTAESCPANVPSYQDEIAPLLEARCQTCHALENNSGLWSLGDRASVAEWSDTILRQVRACSQPPPDSGVYLTTTERRALETWLVCGAPDN